ncbi:MAG: hypothetical protein Q4F06_01450 [Eubacteriales bacterium]|nr:hypothetical protein [Eubacteriales bacterium]
MFNEDKWKDLSVEEREKLIDKFVECIGDELGIENIPFVAYYEANEYDCGFYDFSDNSVNINELFLDNPKEIVEILTHIYNICLKDSTFSAVLFLRLNVSTMLQNVSTPS